MGECSNQTKEAMPSDAPDVSRRNEEAGRRRILVLFAHPSLDRSEANQPLVEATARVDGVTLVDLYAEYPTFEIDVDREQSRLTSHEVICFMHPLYWYSTPAILKEWQDLVLEYGFAYGTGATALHGKVFFNGLTAGGPESAYCAAGFNHFTNRCYPVLMPENPGRPLPSGPPAITIHDYSHMPGQSLLNQLIF